MKGVAVEGVTSSLKIHHGIPAYGGASPGYAGQGWEQGHGPPGRLQGGELHAFN
ncbi:hypothetical protein [Metallosphaera javensis (ex Sakai et al. 2022)]|uniref:hypothetical protein n=1 Tax=Metallosphaera javensis (ex Sakai et al. 2022) TaxID=2775498 RepID=UPI00258D525B